MTKTIWKFFPATSFGRWSIGLIVAMLVLILIGTSLAGSLYRSVPTPGSITADITARPALALTTLAGIAAGALAFVTGALAILRLKERSLLVFLSTAVGGILMFFLFGEFLVPG